MSNDANNAAHLSFIQTSIGRSLTVFVPTLYRYMPTEHVESFFADGSLRLSCLAQFKKHKDEDQGDRNEGTCLVGANDKSSNKSMFTFNITGSNTYVLSFTTRTGDMPTSFGDARFEIFEPIGLCAEIAVEIPGCQGVYMGSCIYIDKRILVSSQRVPSIDELRSDTEPENVDLTKLLAAGSKFSGPKEYFLKDKRYETQMEYRVIWETNKPVLEPLIVKIANPERFCRRDG